MLVDHVHDKNGVRCCVIVMQRYLALCWLLTARTSVVVGFINQLLTLAGHTEIKY